MITIKDSIDIAYKVSDKTDKYWNFFVVINVVVIGWLVTFDKHTSIPLIYKMLFTVVYFSCISINYFALTKQYGILHCIMTEIREHAQMDLFKTDEMNDLLKSLHFSKRVHLIKIMYVLFIALILYLIWK